MRSVNFYHVVFFFLNVSPSINFQRRVMAQPNIVSKWRPEAHPPRVGNLKFDCQVGGWIVFFGWVLDVWVVATI